MGPSKGVSRLEELCNEKAEGYMQMLNYQVILKSVTCKLLELFVLAYYAVLSITRETNGFNSIDRVEIKYKAVRDN